MEWVVFFVRASQSRFPTGMNGAEDMIVDHDMIVTQLFRRLGKGLDGARIAAEFDLRVNHASFHRPLLSCCDGSRQRRTTCVGQEEPEHRHGRRLSRSNLSTHPFAMKPPSICSGSSLFHWVRSCPTATGTLG